MKAWPSPCRMKWVPSDRPLLWVLKRDNFSSVADLREPILAYITYFNGMVLIVMIIGRLVHHKGSLAGAMVPFVVHLREGLQGAGS